MHTALRFMGLSLWNFGILVLFFIRNNLSRSFTQGPLEILSDHTPSVQRRWKQYGRTIEAEARAARGHHMGEEPWARLRMAAASESACWSGRREPGVPGGAEY